MMAIVLKLSIFATMKSNKIILTVVSFLLLAASCVLAADVADRETYIHKYYKLAQSEMRRTGVPASITLAQGLLESEAGLSELAKKSNNHFGIKCHRNWEGKTISHDDDAKGECFRVYDKVEDSYKDHSDFLRYSDRYKSLFELKTTDYQGWAYGLKSAGYATDPAYATKLIKIIESFRLNRYDIENVQVATPAELEVVSAYKVKYSEDVKMPVERQTYTKNKVRFIYSRTGETYSSIAETYDLFLNELLKFNDLDEETELLPGTVVYLARKRARTIKGLDMYIVDTDGENLRDISQRFGVRLPQILKRNGLKADDVLAAGQEVLLR